MILTVSDSEEKILNKIKSILACESTIEFMKITHSEKLIFRGLEVDQLQRRVTRADVVVELTKYEIDKAMTGHSVRERIKAQIEERGVQNLYKITLKGLRDPDILFDLGDMDPYGNVVEVSDETKPAYEFGRLLEQNKDNLLGKFIESLLNYEKDSMEYQALCEGVQALMETRRG